MHVLQNSIESNWYSPGSTNTSLKERKPFIHTDDQFMQQPTSVIQGGYPLDEREPDDSDNEAEIIVDALRAS